jgi:hypothetical protein
MTALVIAAVYLSGVLGWIPLAAVCGALLCEAWYMVDRLSMRQLFDWLRRRPMTENAREDLAVVCAVTACAVMVNMVAAVFAGLLLGLVLFAVRNARKPVRYVWSGLQLSSNCARSRTELRLLTQFGGAIRVYELEGDLFFGATESVERSLAADNNGVTWPIVDWSRVRYIDTSVAVALAQLERLACSRGMRPIHAGAQMQGGNVGEVLMHYLPHSRFTQDLDRALELAENELIQAHAQGIPEEGTGAMEVAPLFEGLDEGERRQLEAVMPHRLYRAGELIVQAGAFGDELMIVLHGSASIVLHTLEGNEVRVAGVRHGATLGDIAFLDQAPRSATVVADRDTTVAVLRRETYDALCISHPRLVQRLLANIALTLAARLRHTNRLALARQSPR